MSITTGTVSVEDGIKAKEEYAPARKVNVTISFEVPEGSDGEKVANEAGDVANAAVQRLLTGAVPARRAGKSAAQKDAAPPAKAAEAGGKTKDQLAAELGLPANAGLPDDGLGGASEPAEAEDTLDDLLGPEAPKPITDAELTDAAQKKNKAMKEKDPKWSPVKIRELCVKYAGADKHFRDIPAAKRADFLKELSSLT